MINSRILKYHRTFHSCIGKKLFHPCTKTHFKHWTFLLSTIRSKDEEREMNWLYDFDDGLRKVRVDNKVMLLYFCAEWCGWCRKLVQETYDNQNVVLFLNEQFVCLKVDIDQNLTLAENYQNHIVPTTVFISSNRIELGRIEGYIPPDQFLEYTKGILTKYSSIN